MRQPRLGRLFGQIVLLVAPLPMTAACGAATEIDTTGVGGTGTGSGGYATGGSTATGGTGGVSPNCRIPDPGCSSPTQGVLPRYCVSADGTATQEQCSSICTGNAQCCGFCTVDAITATTATVTCQPTCAVGRRVDGFRDDCGGEVPEHAVLGTYYARAARLESAAVIAFRQLRHELGRRRAPRRLLRAASRAARDEIRHTRASAALARRFGALADTVVTAPATEKSLEAFATENAVEGCIRETYGALVATWQARSAREPAVRAVMAKIAHEETRHAELGWSLHRWLSARLDPRARDRVQRRAREAVAELAQELVDAPAPELVERAGLPDPITARRLLGELDRALWS